MKIVTPTDDMTILYLNKYYIKDVDYHNKSSIESYFKKIIFNLKKNYNIHMSGFYNVNIYINNNYGIIITLDRIDEDFLFNNIIDMKIIFHFNSDILYEINDYYLIKQISFEGNIYFYKDNFYINPNIIDDINMLKILEFSKIIYNDKINDIINDGILIKEKDV